ncbi:MAG: ATP-dependent zinc metalloprotease FtsH [Synergistaceae bacterium]|nr:ATP-dependent zinc metalloprotease FtsH [Synergistaceae bacterium]
MRPVDGKSRVILIVVLLLILIGLLSYSRPATTGEVSLTYDQFKSLLNADGIRDVLLTPREIRGTTRLPVPREVVPPHMTADLQRLDGRFTTGPVDDPQLVALLEEKGVSFRGANPDPSPRLLLSWGIPLLLMLFFSLIGRRGTQGNGSVPGVMGKSRARISVQTDVGVSFADVAGVDEAKEELQEIISFLRNPERFTRLGGKMPKGMLLVGPPGTGKTLLAKAVAGEANVPFFSISGSEFVEVYVGVGAARVRDLFDQAKKTGSSIIFIDELDALGKVRGIGQSGGHEEREQTLNQLLVEMDGFDSSTGVVVLGATNRPEVLDPALLRPGRFDRHVVVDRPDIGGREAILRAHAKSIRIGDDVDLHVIAARTPGFVGADLANVVNEAALLAARREKAAVTLADFDEAIDRVTTGLQKKSRRISEREKRIVAYHEAGHALAAHFSPGTEPVHKISIIPTGIGALGYTQQLPEEDRYLLTEGELRSRIRVLLGGRAAERLIFGEVTTGAQNDLTRATELAGRMVREYGMSRLGLVTFREMRPANFLGLPQEGQRAVGPETAQALDAEVDRLINEAFQEALTLLDEKRGLLETIANALLMREVLDRSQFLRIVDGRSGSPDPDRWT